MAMPNVNKVDALTCSNGPIPTPARQTNSNAITQPLLMPMVSDTSSTIGEGNSSPGHLGSDRDRTMTHHTSSSAAETITTTTTSHNSSPQLHSMLPHHRVLPLSFSDNIPINASNSSNAELPMTTGTCRVPDRITLSNAIRSSWDDIRLVNSHHEELPFYFDFDPERRCRSLPDILDEVLEITEVLATGDDDDSQRGQRRQRSNISRSCRQIRRRMDDGAQ